MARKFVKTNEQLLEAVDDLQRETRWLLELKDECILVLQQILEETLEWPLVWGLNKDDPLQDLIKKAFDMGALPEDWRYKVKEVMK